MTLRRSTVVRKAPDCFEHSAVMAVENPLTFEEAMGSSYHVHGRQTTTEELKSIEDSRTWTKAALTPGKRRYNTTLCLSQI